jgi:hypothetical protein
MPKGGSTEYCLKLLPVLTMSVILSAVRVVIRFDAPFSQAVSTALVRLLGYVFIQYTDRIEYM